MWKKSCFLAVDEVVVDYLSARLSVDLLYILQTSFCFTQTNEFWFTVTQNKNNKIYVSGPQKTAQINSWQFLESSEAYFSKTYILKRVVY